MLSRLRAHDPGQPLWQVLFYRACRCVIRAMLRVLYRARFVRPELVPPTGGLLIIANHQSHLDPPLVGVGMDRHAAAIARQGLFRNPLMGLVLRGLGAIPIRENEGDAGALRTAIAELKKGRVVVIFPEGTRSPDGTVQAFKRGSWLLMSRAGVDVLPVGIEGAFDAWPRTRRRPRVRGQRCAVVFGRPLAHADLKRMGAEKGLEHLACLVDGLRMEGREILRRETRGAYPAHGPADAPRPGCVQVGV